MASNKQATEKKTGEVIEAIRQLKEFSLEIKRLRGLLKPVREPPYIT